MIKVFLKFNFFLFPFVWVLAFVFSVLESFTYSGFLPGTRFFLIWAVLSGALVRTMPPKKKVSKQWLSRFNNLFVLNKFVFILILITTAATLFLEEAHYSNYVFSRIHLQPHLLIGVCFLSGFLVLLDLSRLDKKWFLEKLFKERRLARGLSRAFYLFFTIFLLAFVIYNSATLATKFYQDELKPEREMEIHYALREINIVQWIEKKFLSLKEVIFWCDKNPNIQKIISFDPDLTWATEEGLLRVFMTNCNLIYIDSLNEADLLTKKSLLFISLGKCQPAPKDYISPKEEIKDFASLMKILEIFDNQLLCKSREILPHLYRFEPRLLETR